MAKVKRHRFNGVSYLIDVDTPCIGWCDRPHFPDSNEYPAIRLPNGLPSGAERGAKIGLETLLHECFHAEEWEWSEEFVDRLASDIGGLLWRLGYRRVKK